MNMPVVIASLAFPLWLRLDHYINILFIGLMIRSGIQILGAHPRLYWSNRSEPNNSRFKFTKNQWIKFTSAKLPDDKLYTSMDDEIPVSSWIAQPGGDNLGLGRLWHFFVAIFWILNGVVYIVLLFATGEWSRLIPTSWDIFPRAVQTFFTYITFHVPPASDFRPYDPLQQLTYAAVVFLLGPFLIVTAAAQSPAIEAHFPWYVKLFGGRQSARSLHFLGLAAMVAFIIVHTALVLIVHFQNNIRDIVLGTTNSSFGLALTIAIIALLFVIAVYVWASMYSLRHKRKMQTALSSVVDPTRKALLHSEASKQHYKPEDITRYFWVNGEPPDTAEYERLVENNFEDWKLDISGLVEHPLHLSLADLRALPKQTQMTLHNCIQGWSGIAEWGGVSMSEILRLCKPTSEARYVVFTSYQKGRGAVKPELKAAHDQTYYETIDMELAKHPQTILAYEMNGEPLPIPHGAPLRLRVETQLGYKMVKYLHSISFVKEYNHIGEGQGGLREDYQYYGHGAEI